MRVLIFISTVLCCYSEASTLRITENDFSGNQSLLPYEGGKVLSRSKRYLVFPKGSSLQLVLESLNQIEQRNNYVLGPQISLAWELPSEPSFRRKTRRIRSSNIISPELKAYLESHISLFKNMFRSRRTQTFTDDLVYCNTYLLRPVVDIFRFGMTSGLAWMLPDDPMIYSQKDNHKIFKRSVFKKLEALMIIAGVDGKQCVLKALCESGQRTPSKKPFVTELLHRVFSVTDEEDAFESHDEKEYRRAHRAVNQNCDQLYPNCGVSLFNQITV